MAGPAHDIGKYERQERFEKPAADSVQHLNREQEGWIVEPHGESAAQWNSSEGKKQKWLAAEVIRPGDEQCHQDRGELGDEGRRGEAGRWRR